MSPSSIDELMTNEIEGNSHVSRFSDTAFTILVENQNTAALEKLAKKIGSTISDMLIEVDKRTTSTTASIAIVKIEKIRLSQKCCSNGLWMLSIKL